MTDAKKKIAAALAENELRREIEAEVRAHSEKLQAINQADEVVLSAVRKWTGQDVGTDDPIPIVRGGRQVATLRNTLLTGRPIARVSSASLIEHKAEIDRKIEHLKAVEAASLALIEVFESMSHMDRGMLEAGQGIYSENALRAGRPPLAERLIGEVGLVTSAFIAARALAANSVEEINKLQEELQQRSSKPGRPRNEAAHAVARELALLYAKVTGKKPTYSEGVSGLSGDYTPALRDVFDALGWKSTSLRGPAEAAIAAISEDDMRYEETAIGGLLSSVWPS